MKKMHLLGVIATSLIALNVLAGCSGDDTPPANTPGAAGMTGSAGMTGTAGMPGTGGGSGMTMGTQLQSPAYFTYLSGDDAKAGAAAPAKYTSAICNSCHGDNGEGKMGLGPELRFLPKDYAMAVVRGGRSNPDASPSLMAAFGADTIADADLDGIVTWLNGLPKPTTGQGLYKAMCANCHGPSAPTGGSAPVSIQGKSKTEVAQFVRNGNGTDFKNRKEYMPKFDATLLSETELGLIEGYLGSM